MPDRVSRADSRHPRERPDRLSEVLRHRPDVLVGRPGDRPTARGCPARYVRRSTLRRRTVACGRSGPVTAAWSAHDQRRAASRPSEPESAPGQGSQDHLGAHIGQHRGGPGSARVISVRGSPSAGRQLASTTSGRVSGTGRTAPSPASGAPNRSPSSTSSTAMSVVGKVAGAPAPSPSGSRCRDDGVRHDRSACSAAIADRRGPEPKPASTAVAGAAPGRTTGRRRPRSRGGVQRGQYAVEGLLDPSIIDRSCSPR